VEKEMDDECPVCGEHDCEEHEEMRRDHGYVSPADDEVDNSEIARPQRCRFCGRLVHDGEDFHESCLD
jgi:hypothetical protein